VARQAHAAGKLTITQPLQRPGVLHIEMFFAGASRARELGLSV
jgi:hypothetical protein